MEKRTGTIHSIVANLVAVKFDTYVSQGEICHIILDDGTRLMSEVIKVTGNLAYTQVYESTRGVRIGEKVEFSGEVLEMMLGPGLLGKNIDGLGNHLDAMEEVFLKRGHYIEPIELEKKYDFTPYLKEGEMVKAGDWLGFVKEGWLDHKIMVPFKTEGIWTIKEIKKGEYKIKDTIAVLESDSGILNVSMYQRWPIKTPIKAYAEKPRPFKILATGVRTMDTLNPMAEGGTGFIPGPFGSGKTVLQHTIARHADVDIVLVAACGERANEVVEMFKEFPELDDPRTGRKLKERTIIVVNTSNMPVAAREASVYNAMTIGEYYRQMGYKVLMLADSTSRWAQALREISNRMEELPGPDAFPMDLPFTIANFYSRAGFTKLHNGESGSVTFIGTVSPAGGNLKEPVTESTKKVARCFYALSQKRADTKRYPAVDPMDSYSKYLEYPELQKYLKEKISEDWVENVFRVKNILLQGSESKNQIDILGDDSVPIDYHKKLWNSELIDFVILQQDAFDEVDAFSSFDRQQETLESVLAIIDKGLNFANFNEVRDFYKSLIHLFKQMSYQVFKSDKFNDYKKQIDKMVTEKDNERN